MKKFNINNDIYIQITKEGWKYLEKTVGASYVLHCIKAPGYEVVINGEIWYKLQAHQVFDILPNPTGSAVLYSTEIMFDEKDLKENKQK